MKRTASRAIILALAALLVTALMLSSIGIVTHSGKDHECTGGFCAICYADLAHSNIQRLALAAFLFLFSISLGMLFCSSAYLRAHFAPSASSPTELCVKLLN